MDIRHSVSRNARLPRKIARVESPATRVAFRRLLFDSSAQLYYRGPRRGWTPAASSAFAYPTLLEAIRAGLLLNRDRSLRLVLKFPTGGTDVEVSVATFRRVLPKNGTLLASLPPELLFSEEPRATAA